MKKQSKLQLVVVGFVLAIGFGVAWGFGLTFLGSLAMSLIWPTVATDYEELVFDSKGQPLIQLRVGGDYDNVRYRTLEGENVEIATEDILYATRMNAPYREPRLFEYPIMWSERIAGLSGPEKPPCSWVFVRDDRRPGMAYLVGHDPKTRQCVGYIGKNGHRPSRPPREECFEVGNGTFGWGSNLVASTGEVVFGHLGYGYSLSGYTDDEALQPWQIFVRDSDNIRQIDLRSREVKLVKQFDGLVGIAVGSTQGRLVSKDQPPQHRLYVRCLDRFVVYNPFEDTQISFEIPDGLKQTDLSINSAGSDELILHHTSGQWEHGKFEDLITVNSNGNIVGNQQVKLLAYGSVPTATDSLIPGILAPTLVGWLVGVFVAAPLSMLQEYHVPDYLSGINEVVGAAWPGLLFVLVVSCVLMAIILHLQRKYLRPNTTTWTAFVFLTGLPGFFAYWVMHRREPLAACPSCKREVPRNREACACCAELFPEPKLLGMEVFA